MGGGSWSASTYAATTRSKIDSGTSFSYTKSTSSKSRSEWKVAEDLDPKKVAGPGSPFAGQTVRESRDNPDHPNSVPIATIFDTTGSMGSVPRVTQEKLAGLFGLLLRQGYVEDPQIMIGAYGDAYVDRVPLQISQFESDNRIDEALDQLFLEGGGGGNSGETQSLAWYYLAYHTATDAWDKRGKKGYAFFVADEVALDLRPSHVADFIGDGEPIGKLDTAALAQAVSEKWDVYILLINNTTASWQGSEKFYKNLFGDRHVLVVEDPNSIAETIALAIGALEGTVDLDEDAEEDLKATGSNEVAIRSAVNATSVLKGFGSGAVAKGSLDIDTDPSNTFRL
jgi:hypothetical protein